MDRATRPILLRAIAAVLRNGVIVCQNLACLEQYNLGQVVTMSDEEMMGSLTSAGAKVIGRLSGQSVLVGHSNRETSENDLITLLNIHSNPESKWTCDKCQAQSGWNASYLTLRDSFLRYYTGSNLASWGFSHIKIFEPSKFVPPLPPSILPYLLDGKLYDTPEEITSDSCRAIVRNHINEAANAISRARRGSVTESEAAILSLTKLILSYAVRKSDSWDRVEGQIARIVLS
jgi:hypothetical protein